MLDILKGPIQAIQEFYELTGRAIRNVARKPHYVDDILLQMDTIGVGSIPIVLLTGFFSGAVMALQMGARCSSTGRRAGRARSSRSSWFANSGRC